MKRGEKRARAVQALQAYIFSLLEPKGLGFEVSGLGFRVWDFKFRMWGLGFAAESLLTTSHRVFGQFLDTGLSLVLPVVGTEQVDQSCLYGFGTPITQAPDI